MTNAFDALPWWLAVIATVIVGGVSMAATGDVWTSLTHAGIAFVAFLLIGALLRYFFTRPSSHSKTPPTGYSKSNPVEEITELLGTGDENRDNSELHEE